MTPIHCAELSNTYDINLFEGAITHCCKFESIVVTSDEINKLGSKIFDFNKETFKARQDLLNGIQTERCRECWNLENKNLLSWRLLRNQGANINRITVNIQISSLCNQSCYYCVPSLSSTISSKFDNWINFAGDVYPIKKTIKQNNLEFKHVVGFIQDLPAHINSLVLSVTGGEPFLVDNFENDIVELANIFLEARPDNQVQLVVSTNGNTKSDKLLHYYEKSKKNSRIKIITSLSLENLEDRAEYVRGGLIWSNFIENFKIHRNMQTIFL